MISAAIAQMDIATSNRYVRESSDSVAVHTGRRTQTCRGCSCFGEHLQSQADALRVVRLLAACKVFDACQSYIRSLSCNYIHQVRNELVLTSQMQPHTCAEC